jgi:predicted membrane protein
MQSNPINKKGHILYSIKYTLKTLRPFILSAVSILSGIILFCIFIQLYIIGTIDNRLDRSHIYSMIAYLFISIFFLIAGLLFWPKFSRVLILYENRMEFTNPHSKIFPPNLPLKRIPYSNIEKIEVDLYYQEFQVHLKEKEYKDINPIVAYRIPIYGITREKLKMIITTLRKTGVQIDYPSR